MLRQRVFGGARDGIIGRLTAASREKCSSGTTG
jgi:hypothetical protein